MENLLLLFLFCHVSSSLKHSLKFFMTASSGVPNFPEYVVTGEFDGILVGSCNSNKKIVEVKHDWVKIFLEKEPQHLMFYSEYCSVNGPVFFKTTVNNLKQRFNQSGEVHVVQRVSGCEWDDETGEINGFMQFGYNGEDFLSLDLKTSTWIAPKQEAFITKQRWDADEGRRKEHEIYLKHIFPMWLKMYVAYGKTFLLRKELPSVSLLQKTPSSPVTCHASGFYPDIVSLFWRKDGEEIHENVDHGEILHNHDGTFQMSVDLNISSVTPADWRRYECVFQLSGVKDDIVTKLDKDVIRTNWEDPSIKGSQEPTTTVPIIVLVVALFVLVAVIGFIIYRKKKAKNPPSPPDSNSQTSGTESRDLIDKPSQ